MNYSIFDDGLGLVFCESQTVTDFFRLHRRGMFRLATIRFSNGFHLLRFVNNVYEIKAADTN